MKATDLVSKIVNFMTEDKDVFVCICTRDKYGRVTETRELLVDKVYAHEKGTVKICIEEAAILIKNRAEIDKLKKENDELKNRYYALLEASKKLKADLLMRGEKETNSDGSTCTVVDVSSTCWISFNEAIDALKNNKIFESKLERELLESVKMIDDPTVNYNLSDLLDDVKQLLQDIKC